MATAEGTTVVTQKYALAQHTVPDCAPPEMVRLAAQAGYDYVSPRIIPFGLPGERKYLLAEDKVLMRQTKAALAATGVAVHAIELARIFDGLEPNSYLPAFEAAAEVGARHVVTSAWAADAGFIIDRYAALCDLAKPLGLTVDFEFPTFSAVSTLQEARYIVGAADRENCGILIDALYIHYSRVSLEELDGLPRAWLHFVHLCDAPADIPTTKEGMVHVARDERLYPGEGSIDLAGIMGRLPDVVYAIETPHTKRASELGYEEHARRCLQAAKRYFAARRRTGEDS
jgi:sugar phosphate isomerase/epimerase